MTTSTLALQPSSPVLVAGGECSRAAYSQPARSLPSSRAPSCRPAVQLVHSLPQRQTRPTRLPLLTRGRNSTMTTGLLPSRPRWQRRRERGRSRTTEGCTSPQWFASGPSPSGSSVSPPSFCLLSQRNPNLMFACHPCEGSPRLWRRTRLGTRNRRQGHHWRRTQSRP